MAFKVAVLFAYNNSFSYMDLITYHHPNSLLEELITRETLGEHFRKDVATGIHL